MTRQPMTAPEIVEALCKAQSGVTAAVICGGWDKVDAALEAKRDRIKAALVEVLEGPWIHPCGDPECESHECEVWRSLEEACRGN